MRVFAFSAVLLFGIAALGGCESESSTSDDGRNVERAALDTLRITNAWVRPAPEGGVTALYLELHNRRATADTLMRVETPVSSRTELHTTVLHSDGTTGMRPLNNGLAVPTDTTTTLRPGGPHVMVYDVQPALVIGDSVRVTLHFGDLMHTVTAHVRPTPPQ
ncbi:hypothetical protein CRI93_00645 [Longimonas halophila]|uniref:Copper chaperone PCu(A)C n=1 Tax=Longimonas halophila TaxID=1469170 RepID=A0A2H3P114_9BACT|nr:copper chaperone PCu(A)C [Longimonas halophila]PEN09270.1 hypothetical protein CRI93_00645 [Longimonas halophila]